MGRRRLKGSIPRVFRSHAGAIGRAYRARFEALEESIGPFTSRLERQEAARTASLGVQVDLSIEALVAAQRARASGKGRRPSVQEVQRLAKRAGLQDTSYSTALDRLQALVGSSRRPATDPASLLKAAGVNGR